MNMQWKGMNGTCFVQMARALSCTVAHTYTLYYITWWCAHHQAWLYNTHIQHAPMDVAPHLDAVREEVQDQLVSLGSLWVGHVNNIKLGNEAPVGRQDNGLQRREKEGRGVRGREGEEEEWEETGR